MFSGDYQLELTRPVYLASLVALLWIVYYFYRSLVDLERWQRILSALVRAIVIGLLASALAGLNLLRPTDQQFVIVAVDESLSVDEQSQDQLNTYIKQIETSAADHEIAYLPFAAQPGEVSPIRNKLDSETDNASHDSAAFGDASVTSPAAEAPAGGKQRSGGIRNPDELGMELNQDKARLGTDLAAAIETATAALPPFYVPQVFLITDGNQTHGDAVSAALTADVPIHTIPLPTRSEPEVQISEVAVPAQVRQGEPFYVEVVINSNHDDEGSIEIYRGDVKVEGQEANKKYKIKKGENRFRFRQEVTDQRLVNYSARISGFRDQLLDNNMASGLVSAAGKPRVLLVDSDTRTTDHLRWALEEQDIRVDVRPPEGVRALCQICKTTKL